MYIFTVSFLKRIYITYICKYKQSSMCCQYGMLNSAIITLELLYL